MLDKTWKKMYEEAKNVQEFRQISDHLEAGGVAAAVLSIQEEFIREFVLIPPVL